MTKDEMIDEYMNDNYDIIQNHIKEAMKKGEHHIYVGMEWFADDFKQEWVCLNSTRDRLIEDGFRVEEVDYDEWGIYW